LEEFYYHSDNDIRYIDELKRELKNKGFIKDNRVIKKFALKDNFKLKRIFQRNKNFGKMKKWIIPEKRKRTLAEFGKGVCL